MTLAPNLTAARAFLQRFDPEADFFTFQTFDDDQKRKSKSLARIVHADPANGALDTLAKLNQAQRAGIFFTINETDRKGRTAGNIQRVRAVFVDLDGAPLAPVLEAGLEPHVVAESSPGKWHAYWKVDDCPLDQFERVQRALARRFGGDPSVHDLPRVLRLPGFLHRKGEPFLVHTLDGIGTTAPPYTLAEIVGALGLELEAQEPGRTANNGDTDTELRQHVINGDPGQVYPAMLSLAARYIGRGMAPADAIAALQGMLDAAAWRERDPATWQARRADAVELVESAAKKFGDRRERDTRDDRQADDTEIPGDDNAAPAGLHSLLVSLADLDRAAPAPHFVERILPADEVTLLGGHGGLGKSYLALLLGLHIAAGRVFGPLAVQQARVLFYSAEDGAATLRYRVNRLCSALAIEPARLDGRLHLLDMSDADAALHREQVRYLAGEKRVCLTTDTLDDLDALVQELAPGVVIIDGASATSADDEVSRARVRAFVRSLRQRIARPGRAVLPRRTSTSSPPRRAPRPTARPTRARPPGTTASARAWR
ncbi:MAG: AAA family ATPase [Betaproteobacteria bacterium]|nr:AAA family ATPase [Betaproteobacteria bacterium]